MKIYIDFNSKKSKQRLWDLLKNQKNGAWVTIERTTRTQSQNKYYWGVVVKLISEETGMNQHEVHKELAERFLPIFFRDRHKLKEVILAGKTSHLTIDKFKDYIDVCVAFAVIELDIYIPSPNEIIEI